MGQIGMSHRAMGCGELLKLKVVALLEFQLMAWGWGGIYSSSGSVNGQDCLVDPCYGEFDSQVVFKEPSLGPIQPLYQGRFI